MRIIKLDAGFPRCCTARTRISMRRVEVAPTPCHHGPPSPFGLAEGRGIHFRKKRLCIRRSGRCLAVRIFRSGFGVF